MTSTAQKNVISIAKKRHKKNKKLRYKRVLLKLSGEALGNSYIVQNGGETETLVSGFDMKKMRQVAKEIKKVLDNYGIELVIVIGGGNIFRGRDATGIDKNTADYMGMLATVANCLAFEDILKQLGVDVRMNTSLKIDEVAEPYRYKKAKRHLEKGRVVICGGGLGEPGFTTDTASAQRAMNLGCEAILMAKQGTDGIYDGDPRKDKNTKKLVDLTHFEIIERDLRVMDATAATHAREHDIDIVVYDGNQRGMLAKVLCKPRKHGSVVHSSSRQAA